MTFKSQKDHLLEVQKSEPPIYTQGKMTQQHHQDPRYQGPSQSMGNNSNWNERASANTISQMTNPFRTNAYGKQEGAYNYPRQHGYHAQT